MSFLRRLSTAASSFLPTPPSASGSTPAHVPRRATETFRAPKLDDLDEDESIASRASWELSDGESSSGSSISGASSRSSLALSDKSLEGQTSDDDSDSDLEAEADGRPRDRFDMMTRHLWNVAERQGWFRDAEFDGLVSIRYVQSDC